MARKTDNSMVLNLGAFGKHPGWDDHIDDLGLDSDRLVEVRRRLYAEGISANVDSGAWDKLEDGSRLPVFEHLILWLTPGAVCLGRIWSSRDAKGRTQYPMVIVVEGVGVDPSWLVRVAGPRIERARATCAELTEADKVRETIEQLRTDLRTELASAGEQASDRWQPDPFLLAAIADRSELATDGRKALGLLRIIYEIEKEMDEYRRPDSKSWRRSRLISGRPRHMRVPGWGEAGACMLAWGSLLRTQLAEEAPLVLIAPVRPGGRSLGWVDLLVGEPGPPEWYCLRAGVRALALNSEIPYSLEPEFIARCDSVMEGWKRGELGFETGGSTTTYTKYDSSTSKIQDTSSNGGDPKKARAAAARWSPMWVFGVTMVIGAAALILFLIFGCAPASQTSTVFGQAGNGVSAP